MKAGDLLHETASALSANKGRAMLTILGIVIGITAVVAMISVVNGFGAWLQDSMGLGSARVITVTSSDEENALTEDDATFLAEQNNEIEEALTLATTSTTVASEVSSSSSDDSEVTLNVTGVDASYLTMKNVTLTYGSIYSDDDDTAIIIDESAAESIFGSADRSVLGQTVTIEGSAFEIVGISEASSQTSNSNIAFAYLPYQSACNKVIGSAQVDSIAAIASEESDIEQVAAAIEGMLAARHNVTNTEDDEQSTYAASTVSSALSMLETYLSAFNILAWITAGIALLVGGIGIMNMMLTNVTERIREIGLRKSLGARPSDITLQFLSESVTLCAIGGVIGIILGYAGAWGLVAAATQFYPDIATLTPSITADLVIIVFCICAGIGIVFGFYPARRAAKLNPADSLRYQ